MEIGSCLKSKGDGASVQRNAGQMREESTPDDRNIDTRGVSTVQLISREEGKAVDERKGVRR